VTIKWHGGKHYLAPKIIALMPKHLHYVEPYAGGLSVLLAKDPEGVSEVVNDIDGRLTNFWMCLADPQSFPHFLRYAQGLPFCERVWEMAAKRLERPCDTPGRICINCALAFFVTCRQSLAGRMKSFAPLTKRRTRRGMNEQASAWLSAVEGLPAVHERLKRVVILNRDAIDVIRQQDGPDTLFYLDPPYHPDTRTAPKVYAHEMSVADHWQLMGVLRDIKGKLVLSGYMNASYHTMEQECGWHRIDFDLPNNAAGGEGKRRMVESVWTNFPIPDVAEAKPFDAAASIEKLESMRGDDANKRAAEVVFKVFDRIGQALDELDEEAKP
jgi:DNA adenine methylase